MVFKVKEKAKFTKNLCCFFFIQMLYICNKSKSLKKQFSSNNLMYLTPGILHNSVNLINFLYTFSINRFFHKTINNILVVI